VDIPEREFLGARRAPVEAAVAQAHGWPRAAVTGEWIVNGRPTPLDEILSEQLRFYRERPDIVADSLARYAARLKLLELP
ncbi:MAG: hypothetical protein JWM76_4933, partial [Pseudonocardiales bacterium]|nr:hypothetical protein [Pseudonocardiales bacterium]